MKAYFKEKGLSTIFLVVFLILSCGVFIGLKVQTDDIMRKKIPGSSIIYIPSGKYLRFTAFGYSSLLADIVFLWAIQYYSDYNIPERFLYLEHIFSVINDLDPLYFDPYDIGALIAAYEAKDLDLALRILDKGLEKNQKQWIFPYLAGHYAQFVKKDHLLAREYYKKTMEIEGAPDIARRLYADASFKAMDYQTSLETWLEIYKTSEDARIKKIASNHLYQAKAAMDIQALKTAVEKYKKKFGRNPMDLSRLVKAGFVDSLPKDLDGKDYVYDPRTAEVKSPTIPWKR